MFQINGRSIVISRGDTGILTIAPDGVTLTDADRAVFTVRRQSGGILCQKVAAPMEDGKIYIPFTNDETDGWRADVYEWDARIVLDAVTDADGKVTDGREVITPWPPSRFEVVRTVGLV